MRKLRAQNFGQVHTLSSGDVFIGSEFNSFLYLTWNRKVLIFKNHYLLTFWISAPAGIRCDDCACLIASCVKAAPSLCGRATAIDMQANKQKTTFILLMIIEIKGERKFIGIFKLFMLIVKWLGSLAVKNPAKFAYFNTFLLFFFLN